MGADWGSARRPNQIWDELRRPFPHARRHVLPSVIDELGGIQWPCPDLRITPALRILHGWLWERSPPPRTRSVLGRRVGASGRSSSTEDYPIRLTTGRRLDGYNTGVQSERLPLTDPARSRDRHGPRPGGEAVGARRRRHGDGSRPAVGRSRCPVRITDGAPKRPGVHGDPQRRTTQTSTRSRSTLGTRNPAPPNSKRPQFASKRSRN